MGNSCCRSDNLTIDKRDYDNFDYYAEKIKHCPETNITGMGIRGLQSKGTFTENIIINAQMFIKENKGDITKDYQALKIIGQGSFGKVYKVKHNLTGNIYALKVVRKSKKINDKMRESKVEGKAENSSNKEENVHYLMNEILILKKLEHPNIMKVYEYYINDNYLYYIMEYIKGVELYEHICNIKYYDEYHAAKIMRQIFSVISYLNQMNIVHRDLKPENMMTTKKVLYSSLSKSNNLNVSENCDPNVYNDQEYNEIELKVIDFGTACTVKDNQKLTVKIGSPFYISPEVLKGEYGKECDVWSAGVIMYILLIGFPPFDGKSKEEIFEKILKKDPDFQCNEYTYISSEAKDLIRKLLEKNPCLRITASEALIHPWIQKYAHIASYGISSNGTIRQPSSINKISISLKTNLQSFSSRQKLHQAIVAFLVHNLHNSRNIRKLTKIFQSMDKSGEGLLSLEELKEGYNKYFNDSFTDQEFEEIMKKIDTDQSGQISIEEFLSATVDYENLISVKKLKFAFDFFDKDHNGFITPDEVKEILGLEGTEEFLHDVISDILTDCDTNKDGKISFDEFKIMMINKIVKEGDEECKI